MNDDGTGGGPGRRPAALRPESVLATALAGIDPASPFAQAVTQACSGRMSARTKGGGS